MTVRARVFPTFGTILLALAAGAAAFLAPVGAQVPVPPPVAPAHFDPSDVYYEAWRATTEAENLEKDGNPVAALARFQHAAKLLESITRYYPDWKPGMVGRSAEKNAEAVARVKPLAEEQLDKERAVMAELEGGQRTPAGPGGAPAVEIEPPGVLRENPVQRKQLEEEEKKIQDLRQRLKDASATPAEIASQREQYQRMQRMLQAAEAEAARLRAQLARAPMAGEVATLNRKVADLEQERKALSMALERSSKDHLEALARAEQLEAYYNASRQQAADLKRDLDLQTRTTAKTVAGMKDQLRALEATIKQRDRDLAAAKQEITGLKQDLEQSRQAYETLRAEHETLAAERDQLKALLNLSEPERFQELIDQNMAIHKQFRELQDKYDILRKDNEATKDQLLEALNELVVFKARINRLHAERVAQDRRIRELEDRLQREDKALAAGTVAASPEELETLREVIRRQLTVQKFRTEQTQILIEAARKLAAKDERLAGAISVLEGAEFKLTDEEQKLVAGRADAEMFNPGLGLNPERAEVNRREQAQLLAGFDRAATKAFVAERFGSARDLFELMLDENPGNVAALCKHGVVCLRLEDIAGASDSFRKAVELDPNNPYAHRMLGAILERQNDLEGAEKLVRRSVELARDDATSQSLLGLIYYQMGRLKDAETHYKAAIAADPLPSEPYFNLAFICARDANRLEEARDYYRQALERGAVPDAELEKTLAKH
ncbi:MAG: tetratricopeptide repeat protein [Akkermansiaceae bacterium]|jgi:Flp pilus assembly protein TadD|nr:tetratricopeptide repeat protein [Akkermansiaceae bacterium]